MMKLKQIHTKHFPKKGYKALTMWPFVFVRKDCCFSATDLRHETTHALQQIETLWLLFFVIYGLEYVIKYLICKFDSEMAYMSVSFEQEAYEHQDNYLYNGARAHFTWIQYIFTIK